MRVILTGSLNQEEVKAKEDHALRILNSIPVLTDKRGLAVLCLPDDIDPKLAAELKYRVALTIANYERAMTPKCEICGAPLTELQTSHCSFECIQEDVKRRKKL